jgi:hypothetical protein
VQAYRHAPATHAAVVLVRAGHAATPAGHIGGSASTRNIGGALSALVSAPASAPLSALASPPSIPPSAPLSREGTTLSIPPSPPVIAESSTASIGVVHATSATAIAATAPRKQTPLFIIAPPAPRFSSVRRKIAVVVLRYRRVGKRLRAVTR